MTLIDAIRDRIANAIQPQRTKNPNEYTTARRNIGSVSGGNELAVSAKGTVFACLQHRANALANLTFEAYRENEYDKEELARSHWVNQLLSNPNPYFTRSQVFSYIENWLSINGNAFIWTPTNGYRVPLQMWVLNPTRVRIIKGSDNFIEGYVYQSAQEGNIAIPEREVIHLARIHPSSRPEEIVGMNIFGVGLVTAALEYANIDREVSAYLSRLFKNNTIPPLIAKYPERYDYNEWEALKSRWNEELPDYKLRALLAGGLSLELPPKGDLTIGYDSVSNDTRSQIAQVFGVPPGMLTGEYQNRATAEVQWAIFRQNTIDPEATYIAEEFTRHFKRWEDSVLIEAERFVYDDPIVNMQKEEFELKWGIKTINEARAERGYDETTFGSTPLISSGLMPLQQVIESVNTTNLAPTNDVAMRNGKYPILTMDIGNKVVTQDKVDYFWRKYDGLTMELSQTLEKIVSRAFSGMEKQVLAIVSNGGTNIDGVQIPEQVINQYLGEINLACNEIKNSLALELGVSVEDIPVGVNQYISQVTNESSTKIAESVTVAKKNIQDVLRKTSGEPRDVIFKALTSQFNNLKTSRAKTIAQTTSANATSAVQYTMYKENGFRSMWISQRDGAVRPAHLDADGQKQDLQGFFMVGGERTERPLGSGLSAKNAVNCRCQLFPVR